MASEPVNVNEFRELAREVLPKMYYDFYTGGAEDQHTLNQNVDAFRRIMLRHRVLVDVSRIDMSTIMIAPTARHQLAHPEGKVATARAAAACNTIMVLSNISTCTVEDVASSCNAVRNILLVYSFLSFYPAYWGSSHQMLSAEKSGDKAIVLTVDAPRLGRREADIKNRMVAPQLKNFEGILSTDANSLYDPSESTCLSMWMTLTLHDEGSKVEAFVKETFDASLCWEPSVKILFGCLNEWLRSPCDVRDPATVPNGYIPSLQVREAERLNRNENSSAARIAEQFLPLLRRVCMQDIEWLKSITNLPILIKGVLTHEVARKAVEVGVAGIVVSNHGGHQLDYTPTTISVLEEEVDAVGGKVPVLLDGGVRRGTDVFKALALGAQAVLVGRPVIYGLAANGEHGVRRVIKMLKDEFELTMALCGCPGVMDITRSHVRTECDKLHSML
ncbi:unnamed protein product [Prunus armeniaca]|uniref:FMN hydroxy acid dehydrogenase domain-containing protein n=1 Tax=Prunus armeniaca TaxID=36596 RepID=A0A6J5W6I2_PRUAR|nr:unnamed protein product [Prunus armeniaca]